MRDAYKTYKLPKIGRSDHHPVVLLPKHKPVSRSNTTPVITTRNLSSENSDKVLCALETTDWSELVSNESDASTKCDIISDYISFCYDDCIPLVNKVMRHDKTWMTAKIQRLLIARSAALTYHDHIALNQLQSKIQYQIRKAKRSFAKQVEKQFNSSDRRSWSHLKKLLRLNNSKPKECNLPPDALNDFYLRFEKDLQPPSLPALSSQCPQMEVADVIKALRSINTKKSTGPDNIPGRVLKLAAHSLGEPLCDLFNSCLEQGQFPSTWKKSVIKPIPKSSGASAPKDFRPVALTAVVAKVFERLLL